MLMAALAGDRLWTARYEREAMTLGRLPPHPNVVAVIDHGRTVERDREGVPYYVMDWVAKDTLQQQLAQTGRMSLIETQRLLGPVFDALAHIHAEGLIHRDLKPSSIGIGTDGVPRLLDFGLALEEGAETDQLTRTGTVIGTPTYMSPEQIRGERTDARADLYSLGVILFECLTGSKPYRGDVTRVMHDILIAPVPSAIAIVPELPLLIDRFFEQMMAKQPENRFRDAATAKQFFMALGVNEGDKP
jgi:serine/threonine-protein kinase